MFRFIQVPARLLTMWLPVTLLLAALLLAGIGRAEAQRLSLTRTLIQGLDKTLDQTVDETLDLTQDLDQTLGLTQTLDQTVDETMSLAQSLPVQVSVSGNTATVRVGLPGLLGLPGLTLADMTLAFSEARNLTPSSLGISAELVSLDDLNLLSRLGDIQLTQLVSSLPVLITIEPPATANLSFDRMVRAEVHTHLLPYTAGSRLRLFKASLGEGFRDITDEIAPGSVRARGTTSGFSQFLILLDLRPTSWVVAEKFGWLRNRIDNLPASVRDDYASHLDVAEAALADGDHSGALIALEMIRANASAQAGDELSQEWLAGNTLVNEAGGLMEGVATLRFSIEYLRDYGQ